MAPRKMCALAAGPGEAKIRENVADALRFLHGDMPLHSPGRHNREGACVMQKWTNEAAAAPAGAVEDGPGAALGERVFCPADRPTLHHVSLFVPDLEVSTKFYVSGLGLTLREEFEDIIGRGARGDFPFKVASVFLEAGDGRYVELHPAGQGAMSPPGFPLNHLAFGVVDVDAAYARALDAGATPFDIPVPEQRWDGAPLDVVMSGGRPEPMRMAFLQGPSGELIELYQAAAASTPPAEPAA